MAIAPRLFPTDEELGKKDDDHKPAKHTLWPFRRKTHLRKRRVAAFTLFCLVAWVFIRNIPTHLRPARERFNYDSYSDNQDQPPWSPLPSTTTQGDTRPGSSSHSINDGTIGEGLDPSTASEAEQGLNTNTNHYYNGPIKFFDLADTLKNTGAEGPGGKRNVLFAASDLKAASALVSMACDMSRWDKNRVQFALMGREDISIEDVKELNSATEFSCDIVWHDARPDFGLQSTDARMELSITGALGHMENYLHPKAIITYGPNEEDSFFTTGMRKKANELRLPLIEIPKIETESLSWLTRLESTSLASWHAASIDILIHAQAGTSGSLIRLLKSLLAADYSGFTPPRLTIELPAEVDKDIMALLDDFNWPPQGDDSYTSNNQIILRHRIDSEILTSDEILTRLVESFYPAHSRNSHVLLLSPQAELSAFYYQYLKYQLLEHKYGPSSWQTANHLFGISLEFPSSYLNGSSDFKPSLTYASEETKSTQLDNVSLSPFFWQAPNANAALYFGDKWLEMHSFLSRRHAAAHNQSENSPKFLSSKYPAWSERFLEYMRIRGYVLMYSTRLSNSSLQSTSDIGALVAIHTDLDKPQNPAKLATPGRPPRKSIPAAPQEYLSSRQSSGTRQSHLNEPSLLLSMHHLLPVRPAQNPKPPSHPRPQRGTWWDEEEDEEDESSPPSNPFTTIPILDPLGSVISLKQLQQSAQSLATDFRLTVGGCLKESKPRKIQTAEDLFCLGYEDDEDDDDNDDRVPEDEEDDTMVVDAQPLLAWKNLYPIGAGGTRGRKVQDADDDEDEDDEIVVPRQQPVGKDGSGGKVEGSNGDAGSEGGEKSNTSNGMPG